VRNVTRRSVKEKALLRKLLAATQDIQLSINTSQNTPQEVLESAYRRINDVGESEHQGAYSPEDLLDLAVKQLTTEPQERFSLGFKELDKWTNGGLARGQVMVVAAWPNVSKSILVDQLAVSMVKGSDRKACLYLTEMTVPERNARFIARATPLTITETIVGDLHRGAVEKDGGLQPTALVRTTGGRLDGR